MIQLIFFNPPSYTIYLSSVIAGGRKIAMTNIEVAHRDRDLYFNFDVLSHKRHTPQVYYRLEGPIASKGTDIRHSIISSEP